MLRVLYIASGSISDPLIVSQVLRYLKHLSRSLDACHLITFERESLTENAFHETRLWLAKEGIHWQPCPADRHFRSINIWREVRRCYRLAEELVRTHNLNLIHARSFVPGNVGLQLKERLGIPLLYDMRGFWAMEKRAKGTIRYAWIQAYAQRLEDRLLTRSNRLISLTHAGKEYLRKRAIKTPIDVIPCCVDTELFRPRTSRQSPAPRFVSVGSLGPGYLPEAVFGFFKAAQRRWPQAEMKLITRTSRSVVVHAAEQAGVALRNVLVQSAEPQDVPQLLNAADVGLCFIEPSAAKLASSPTKLAEYLACGMPVVANGNIGDVSQIVGNDRLGVLATSLTPSGFLESVDALDDLLKDPLLSYRCRQVAERDFSVKRGVASYLNAYSETQAARQLA